jgi:hypothetical protein
MYTYLQFIARAVTEIPCRPVGQVPDLPISGPTWSRPPASHACILAGICFWHMFTTEPNPMVEYSHIALSEPRNTSDC